MINLLTYLYHIISGVHTPAYLNQGPSQITNPAYPLITYKLLQLDSVEDNRFDYALEVDLWDKGTSVADISTLADQVDEALYQLRYADNENAFIFTRQAVGFIEDDDELIQRIQVRYQIKNYEVR